MSRNKDDFDAEELRFLHMLESHHKMGIEMANDALRMSSNQEIIDIARVTIQHLSSVLQELSSIIN